VATKTTRTEREWGTIEGSDEAIVFAETIIEDETAEDEKHRAEAAAARAAELKSLAEARKLAAEAEAAEITLRKSLLAEREELTADKHHHTYLFDKEVSEATVKACVQQLTRWERLATDPLTVEMVINSPGGSIFDGFALIDYIDGMHSRGHTVNTTAYGMAASMGGVILEVGKIRSMGRNAMLLIHEAQFGAIGSFGEIEDRVKLVELMHERILDLFVSRAQPINPKTTKAFIRKSWSRRDWWMTAESAVRLGFADAVK